MKRVILANDHGGLSLVDKIKAHLASKGYEINHIGCYDEKAVDYPDIADKAVEEFKKGGYDFGVLICGTGIGISIRANKHNGIVCALPQNSFAASAAKEHNGANFIAFGGRIEYTDSVESMLDAYINTAVSSDERHSRRRAKLNAQVND